MASVPHARQMRVGRMNAADPGPAGRNEDLVPAPAPALSPAVPSRTGADRARWSLVHRESAAPWEAPATGPQRWASPGELLSPPLAFPLPKPLPCPTSDQPVFPLVRAGFRALPGLSQPSSLLLNLKGKAGEEIIGSGGPPPVTAGNTLPATVRPVLRGGRA
ncbi:hypothetical protein GCM10010346_61660 [Streptomyces chryseus]|uniref:Uncharacterized protein n=1 Tax=Streptomyces chryseus TaxID=68186 RepID=A0ABQ3E8H5_9ACTN|nr:hypothetical protein GCM10010346_61660 [Streptomyces chryseus]